MAFGFKKQRKHVDRGAMVIHDGGIDIDGVSLGD